LAEFSAILFDQCFVDTPELRGSVSDFIRRCNKPPILGSRYGKPLRLEGDYVQLDRCGSYTSVYVSSPTPVGAPVLMEGFEDNAPYYFIQVEVLSFRCKHPDDPYPMITSAGVVYADKTWWECFLHHYDVEWKFVSGYSFGEVRNVVGPLAEHLWRLRTEAKERGDEGVQLMIKRTLNSLWGKTLWKGKPISEEMVEPDRVQKYIDEHPLTYSTKRVGNKVRVRVIKPVYMPWQRPQFGVTILSRGRAVMQDVTYGPATVYYCNTDCVLVSREDSALIDQGKELGQFHVEYEMRKFICLSPKKWLRVLNDGTVMHSFGKASEEWFESELRRRTAS
jgi:hypothetical protein